MKYSIKMVFTCLFISGGYLPISGFSRLQYQEGITVPKQQPEKANTDEKSTTLPIIEKNIDKNAQILRTVKKIIENSEDARWYNTTKEEALNKALDMLNEMPYKDANQNIQNQRNQLIEKIQNELKNANRQTDKTPKANLTGNNAAAYSSSLLAINNEPLDAETTDILLNSSTNLINKSKAEGDITTKNQYLKDAKDHLKTIIDFTNPSNPEQSQIKDKAQNLLDQTNHELKKINTAADQKIVTDWLAKSTEIYNKLINVVFDIQMNILNPIETNKTIGKEISVDSVKAMTNRGFEIYNELNALFTKGSLPKTINPEDQTTLRMNIRFYWDECMKILKDINTAVNTLDKTKFDSKHKVFALSEIVKPEGLMLPFMKILNMLEYYSKQEKANKKPTVLIFSGISDRTFTNTIAAKTSLFQTLNKTTDTYIGSAGGLSNFDKGLTMLGIACATAGLAAFACGMGFGPQNN